jgi:hypothetical protein
MTGAERTALHYASLLRMLSARCEFFLVAVPHTTLALVEDDRGSMDLGGLASQLVKDAGAFTRERQLTMQTCSAALVAAEASAEDWLTVLEVDYALETKCLELHGLKRELATAWQAWQCNWLGLGN